MEKKAFLEACRIVTTHGVQGALKAESWCDSPGVLAALPALYTLDGELPVAHRVMKASIFKSDWVFLTLEDCSSLDDAIKYKDKILYAKREDIPLPDGSYFMEDLIGLPVVDADSGKMYGRIHSVQRGAASDLYEIDTGVYAANGKPAYVYFPAVPAFVVRIDPEKEVLVRPIAGMFDAI